MIFLRVFCFGLLLLLSASPPAAYASMQDNKGSEGFTVAARVTDGDTLIIIELEPVNVLAPREFKNRFAAYRYDRTVRNIKRVYPYARLAGNLFREYSEQLLEIESERERRQFIKNAEGELLDEFEDELKRLTFSQGLILIKLIDRETKNTSYQIVREFRGVFSAVFWQSFGRLFGYNLKTEYDPYGEDRMIEEIVQLIEDGLL